MSDVHHHHETDETHHEALHEWYRQQQQQPSDLLQTATASDRFIPITTNPEKRRNSVTIQLPEPKRQKYDNITLTQVMNALIFCVSQEDRIEAIDMAATLFNHQLAEAHDKEIQAKADIVLVKHLALLCLRNNGAHDDTQGIRREISLTCKAIEMILRASSECVSISFQRVGKDLLQLIVSLLTNELNERGRREGRIKMEEAQDMPPPPTVYCSDQDAMLLSVTKVLGHFARVGAATQTIAEFPGLLVNMIDLIKMLPQHTIPWKARLSCLWTIANLACNTENMQKMVCTSGLVRTLVDVLCRPLTNNESSLEQTMEIVRSWSIASRAILNLSWPEENKTCLAENMDLVSALSDLMVKRKSPLRNSKTVEGILLQARQHAAGAIRNLSGAPNVETKKVLCDLHGGRVLDTLTDASLGDNDPRVKKYAFEAIHNLATRETSRIMVARPALILALKNVLLAEEEQVAISRDHVSATLVMLEQSITSDMRSYNDLRALMDAANLDFSSDMDECNESGADDIDANRTIAV